MGPILLMIIRVGQENVILIIKSDNKTADFKNSCSRFGYRLDEAKIIFSDR